MKIIKCDGCSHSIHVFCGSENMNCPHCGNCVNGDIGSRIKNCDCTESLSKKLEEIDHLIAKSKFVSAKREIAEVLEAAPGSKIGMLPNSGEVYWRKLLAETGCKTDRELIYNGKLLECYSSYTNAVNNATEDERAIYIYIAECKKRFFEAAARELQAQKHEKMCGAGIDKLLISHQQELNTLEQSAQERIVRLEEIEKKLSEHNSDYMTAVGEYRHSLETVHTKAGNVGMRKTDITMEEKTAWMAELDTLLTHSYREFKKLKGLEDTDESYLAYKRLIEKQRDMVSEIRDTISKIDDLKSKIEESLAVAEEITEKYSGFTSSMKNGNCKPAKETLSAQRFDELLKLVASPDSYGIPGR